MYINWAGFAWSIEALLVKVIEDCLPWLWFSPPLNFWSICYNNNVIFYRKPMKFWRNMMRWPKEKQRVCAIWGSPSKSLRPKLLVLLYLCIFFGIYNVFFCNWSLLSISPEISAIWACSYAAHVQTKPSGGSFHFSKCCWHFFGTVWFST